MVEPPSLGQRILGRTTDWQPAPDERFVLAIGNPVLRWRLARELTERGARFETIIHPMAYVASTASIGTGCIIAPFATVGANSSLSEQVLLTYYASVAHDAQVGAGSALSPHSVANGGSRLGTATFLGTAAVVNPGVTVGDHAKVAAGSIVYRNVPERSLASGNPAKARPLLND